MYHNGKVERSHRTDLEEFWPSVDLNAPDLDGQLSEWQHYYNWERPHGSLNGRSPMDRYFDLIHQTPLWEDVEADFCEEAESFRHPEYEIDQRLHALKRSL